MVYSMGIDSGSTTAKIVILAEDNIISNVVVPTGANSAKSIQKAIDIALQDAGLRDADIAYRISTGYGRHSIANVNRQITEITCHAKGVHWLFPHVRTIIDIGGQDFKVIRLDKSGSIVEFRMNDKCAAGTGRFLEVMAKVMELDIEEFGKIALNAESYVKITSVCTVFAESEVINHIARGTKPEDLVYGILDAVTTRVYALAKNMIKEGEEVVFTGGVAKNAGVVKILGDKVGTLLSVPEKPQFTGALGAALYAREDWMKNNPV